MTPRTKREVYWCGDVPEKDTFGFPITDTFIDGRTKWGPWALMTPGKCLEENGLKHQLGMGRGQKYVKQPDGRWLKVEG